MEPGAKSVHLKILVDRGSVEVFTGDGKTVNSNLVFFQPGETGISLYTEGAPHGSRT
ncbi:GH32 C-terminal domain-containing protein [Amycolatopsis sp. cmx-11-12]|uniref:GH32 C-terminal domain-containing protein n=1 Tax=Amycolatopsis sp. cmx-11-12 TaxID=2785795 RepID=UPI003917F0C2